MLYINKIADFIPNTTMRVIDSMHELGLKSHEAKIFTKLYGLDVIPIAYQDNVKSLIIKSIIKLLEFIPDEEIKYLIHTHTSRVVSPYGISAIDQVKNELNLSNAISFGVSINNCASLFNALNIVHILLQNMNHQAKAIIVTADKTFSEILRTIPKTSIMGEASSAVLVSKCGKHHKVIANYSKTYGRYSGGVWQSENLDLEFETNYSLMLAASIQQAIAIAGITLDDVKILIPHNVNILSWRKTAKLLGIPLAKIYLANIKHTAHCFGSDIFINLLSALNEDLIKPDDYYLLATVGLGATFSASVVQY